MNAAGLLNHFDRLAEAPDAVERLRRFVLDLAVRGQLVEQDGNDEPVNLKAIWASRARLIKLGEIKLSKQASGITEHKDSRGLPTGWVSAALDTASPLPLIDGDWIESKDQDENGGIRLVQLADVGEGRFLDKSARFINAATESRLNCTRLEKGDVLIARLPNPIGRACIFPGLNQPAITVVDVAILRVDENLNRRYIEIAINSPATRLQIESYGKGTTRFRVSTGHLKSIVLPLPPLAEQHRIVAKVDELMALCDQLQAAHTARESQRARLVAASLHRLTATEANPDHPTPPFTDAARFHLTHLPRLTTRPEHIQQLRQTILNLAVRGKLEPQNPNDGASALFIKQLQDAKVLAVEDGLVRVRNALDTSSLRSLIPDVPTGWTLVAFDDVLLITGGIAKGKALAGRKTVALPYLRVANVQRGRLELDVMKTIEIPVNEVARYRLQIGDVLLTEGGDWDKLGRAAVWQAEIDECAHQNHVFRARPPVAYPVFSRWVEMFANGPIGLAYFQNAAKQTTNLASINMTQLRGCPLPVPPLAEQHRIVAKVDELMQLCDALQVELVTGQTQRGRLLEALLHEALNPSHENVVDMEQARKKRQTDREAIACYTVRRLAKHKSFGRTMQAKVLYMAEAHCRQSLGGTWRRQARGPYDGWIGDFEAQAEQANWFSTTETTLTSGKPKIVYTPGKALDAKANEALAVLGPQAREFDRVLTLFSEKTTEEVEIIATLFAAWNDLMLDGNTPSDDDIVKVVREQWHPDKARFTPDALNGWMKWMRQQHLIPVGIAPHTQYQADLL